MVEEVQGWVTVGWNRDHMRPLHELVCLTKADINKNSLTSLINFQISPCEDTCRVKVGIFRDNICFPEKGVECHEIPAPDSKVKFVVDVHMLVHFPQDDWVYWEGYPGRSLEPAFETLECFIERKVIIWKTVTS